ncbi:hypothetical protein [Streptomyces sp. DSM 41013]
MAHGTEPSSTNVPQPFRGPKADIVVFAGTKGTGRYATPLNKLADGTPIVAAGMVTEIREHGTIDAPRATLILTNDFGQSAYAGADTATLTEYNLCLVDGLEVSLHGIARRPFEGDEELDGPYDTHIQIVRVEPLFA